MNETRNETEAQQVEVINTGEELLLKARATARKIKERVWQVMDEHPLGKPHAPAPPEA
jgi:phosphoribosyl-dephospho-CoA transferase